MSQAPGGSGASRLAASTAESGSVTTTVQEEKPKEEEPRGAEASGTTLKLKLTKKDKKEVKWTTDTVDNEGLGKKKSKCCCIYVKPKVFGQGGESSGDESDGDDCPHCPGHHGNDLNPSGGQGGGGGKQTA